MVGTGVEKLTWKNALQAIKQCPLKHEGCDELCMLGLSAEVPVMDLCTHSIEVGTGRIRPSNEQSVDVCYSFIRTSF